MLEQWSSSCYGLVRWASYASEKAIPAVWTDCWRLAWWASARSARIHVGGILVDLEAFRQRRSFQRLNVSILKWQNQYCKAVAMSGANEKKSLPLVREAWVAKFGDINAQPQRPRLSLLLRPSTADALLQPFTSYPLPSVPHILATCTVSLQKLFASDRSVPGGYRFPALLGIPILIYGPGSRAQSEFVTCSKTLLWPCCGIRPSTRWVTST